MLTEPDSGALALIDAALAARGFSQPLPASLRAAYITQQLASRRPHNRLVAVLLMLIFNLFWLVQIKSAPEVLWLSGMLRLCVWTPLCLLFLLLDWRMRLGRMYDPMVAALAATASLITAVLCVRTTSPTTLSDVRSTPLILLTAGLLMRVSPPALVATVVLCSSSFIISIFFDPVVPRAELGSLIMNDLAIATVTWGFGMMLEGRDRSVFLLRTADQIRRAELAARNIGLQQQSETDALTGLANRRCFDDRMDATWAAALQAGQPLGLIMMDIDHFKLFNDHYGHQGGDDCLVRVAARVRAQVRANDLVARYGGEEFAIVMPGAPVHAVTAMAERVRAAVVAMAMPHAGAGPGCVVSLSLGAASVVPLEPHGARRLIEQADRLLYDAKRAGRNCVGAAVS